MSKTFLRRVLQVVACCTLTVFLSTQLMAQNLNLNVQKEPLKTVLKKITEQTGYQFAYSNAIDPSKIIVDAKAANSNAVTFFNSFFPKIGLACKVVGKTVSLSLKQNQPANAPMVIKGRVLDEKGAPIPGAYVNIKGTTKGVSTDVEGHFELNVHEGDKIVFSFLGYKTLEKDVTKNAASFTNVVLAEDAVALEGVAVIGYGNTQKIKDVTGSIAHVGTKEIQQASMGSNVTSVLQGRAAGVNVQIQSASPTSPVSVVIRGQSSLSGDNQPLWVIDGIPEYNAGVGGTVSNVLYSLNLNDVESVDILKDASSTAIYGSRAANGVIVVTTKSGKEGMKPTLEVSAKLGYQLMNFNGYDYFNAPEYIEFTRAAVRKEAYNRGTFDYFTRLYLDQNAFYALNTSELSKSMFKDLPGAYYDSDTHWTDLMTTNPIQQQYDLTLRGGTKAVSYLASVSYSDMEGIVKTGYSRMFSGRLRLEARVSDAIKVRMSASGSTRNASDKDYMLDVLKKVRPDLPAYNEDGSIFTRDSYTENPYTTLKNKIFGTGENVNGALELEWTILKGLVFTSKGSINYANTESLSYSRRGSTFNTTGSRSWSRPKSDTKIWDNTLLFAKVYGKHDISASLTASMEKYQRLSYSMRASNFPDDDVLNSFSDAAKLGKMGESYTANSMLSQIGRVQYNYDSRYLATFTLRHDGSSRFGKDKRWGWFPSAGLGWTLSNENFIKNSSISDYISFLKIRASYGKSGSQNLSDYQWLTMVDSNVYNEAPGIYPRNIGNSNLQWEEAYMTDLALEMEFWDSRIRATVGYFNKKSENLIYSQTLPLSSAFESMSANIASTKTNGFEFSFDVDVIKNAKWQLTLNGNGATNVSKITKFNNTVEELYPSYSRIKVGEKIGQWYGYETYNRLFGSAEEAAALKTRDEKGALVAYRSSLESEGDIYVKDQDGNGIINFDDCVVLGSALPKLYGGLGFQLYYGNNLNIGATFTYSLGNKRLWEMPMSDVGYTGNYNQSNKIAGMSAVYKSPYDPATMPNATPYGDGENGSAYSSGKYAIPDYWLFDGSYLRLSTLNVSYRLGKEYFPKSLIDNIEFNFQASNLFTLTRYPGFDPQGNFSSSSTSMTSTQGVDYSTYPAAKLFTFGVKLTFR